MMIVFMMSVAIVIGIGLALVVGFVLLESSISDGPIFHPNWEPFNPVVEEVCNDIMENPDDWVESEYSLVNDKRKIFIHISLGLSHYGDKDRSYLVARDDDQFKVGPFAMCDRLKFGYTLYLWRRLKRLEKHAALVAQARKFHEGTKS